MLKMQVETGGLYSGLSPRSSEKITPNANAEAVEQLEIFLDRFIGALQKQYTAREARLAKFAHYYRAEQLERRAEQLVPSCFKKWQLFVREHPTTASSAAMSTLVEPRLPWNVRHPHSKFSTWWEGVQAVLLVYVAFTGPGPRGD